VNLILLNPEEVTDHGTVTIDDGRAAHVRNVLKATPGQSLQVGVIDGPRGVATVHSVDGSSVTLQCTFESTVVSIPPVDLLLALPRPKVMKRLWAPPG
jgi:16S rRNA U1498 N3-methylase RsmE